MKTKEVNIVFDYNFPTIPPFERRFGDWQCTHNCIDYGAFFEYYNDQNHFDSGKYINWYSKKYKTPPQTYNNIPAFFYLKNRINFYKYKTVQKKKKFNQNILYFYPVSLFSQATFSIGDYNNMVFDKISKNVIEELKTAPNFYLMISYFYEGLLYTEEMENLYKWMAKYEIPEEKIYLTYANYNIDEWWKDISKSDIINKKLNFIPYMWPLQYMPRDYKDTIIDYKNITGNFLSHERKIWDNVLGDVDRANQSFNLEYKVENKKYDFNCLIRQLRHHRILLLCYLRMNKLLDKNLVSYDFNSLGFKFEHGYFNLIDDKVPGESVDYYSLINCGLNSLGFDWKPWLYEYFKLYIDEPKKVIDFDDMENIHGLWMETDVPYKDSMFSIVSESYFFESSKVHYISEKVIKPIMHSHPFILFAKSGVLKFMKEKGFKTFHPYIDETYDELENDIDRFRVILDEIKRLCDLTDEEKLEWMRNVKPIVEHNFNHFMSYDKESKKENDRILNDIIKKTILI